MSQLFVRTGINFSSCQHALAHIGEEMLAKGVVHETYPQALLAREATFPTGIALERHAVAIPHCEAVHAKSPAIYLIRPDKPVNFQQADDEHDIAVSLIIALIVENPAAQLKLLRRLFSELQNPDIIDALLNAPETALAARFQETILASGHCAQA
ncbi:PTS galactitol transporter subunit IIA [Citrobacter rodentium]|jgi:Phosphotransferase system mannitol/fructose-specific IIA domain (Ntr-type)|uniref:Component IIA of galactitol-specific phosphotransferase system n=2 Tax=Citrobacter rodentium TaxID=67825 RepID=D2TQ88_CITRI|nr:PTS galactitol transporter subunit IIA [Citrobacter rodentium]KIQ51770.1 PTS system galactitol-specific transporter subunit IIA [Citrobacter rodentium]QBY30994.1 PTS galactitol transporter subunit IIA [Citrobacter rodentium]UHO31638.1 PTS galactitol transporter subunit IIA [Citrobacter rodentium NBRC 105723 = DSM 16636]CBG91442.1 component IIA of galactitol-specific phosphotransferase system [Citrobacter rodentium ICC168]HAT8014898.1 PTS galactitol transporter subunit IIA [Citrobacter roden